MSSSFFYSQDSDCAICSPSLHSAVLDSVLPYYTDITLPMQYPESEHIHMAMIKQAANQAQARRPAMGSRLTSGSSVTSTNTQDSLITSTSSSMTATTKTSASSSLKSCSSSSSRRFKKVLARMPLRHKTSEPRFDLLEAPSEPVRSTSAPTYPYTSDVLDNRIHPYNFFEASLHMDADYSILEDGWTRLRGNDR